MKYKVFLLIIFLHNSLFIYSQNNRIDSVLALIKSDKVDTGILDHIYDLSAELQNSNPDTALYFANLGLKISIKANYKKGIAGCYNSIGYIHYLQGIYDKAFEYYLKSLKIYEESGDTKGMAKCYCNIGIIYQEQESYDKAFEYFFKSLKIYEKSVNKKGMADCYILVGITYDYLGNLSDAKKNEAQTRQNYNKALEYYLKALNIYEESGNKKDVVVCFSNMGIIYREQGNYDKALEYYLKALKIYQESGNKNGMMACYINIGSLYGSLADSTGLNENRRLNYLNRAIEYGTKTIELAKEIKAMVEENEAAELLMSAYLRLGNIKKSSQFADIFICTKDSIFNEEKTKALAGMEAKYQNEKKQLEIIKLGKEKELQISENKKQRMIIWFIVFGLLLVLAFAAFIFRSLRITRKQKRIIEKQKEKVDEAYEELNQQNEEIASQRDEIEAQRDSLYVQNKNITDSITYARFIQQALLTSHEILDNCKIENFILFKPKDIISGDFYWFKLIKNYLYFAAADCTGHGVPGAFMSVLGISLLNEIVSKRDLNPPALVLNELRKKLKKSLKQDNPETTSHDGIDIALCLYDQETKVLQFSGAFNPLFMIRKKQLIEYSANHMPVGIHPKDNIDFTNQEIQLQPEDSIYIFSDGYISQFGGEKGKKFNIKQFKQLLLEINHLPMKIQKQVFEKRLIEWQHDFDQIDDILVIGIKI